MYNHPRTTKPPRKRTSSYRDPDLSDKWLREAEYRALNDRTLNYESDSRKMILRLVKELKKVNKETGR